MKTLAKILAIVLVVGILFTFAACGGGDGGDAISGGGDAISGEWSGESDGTKNTWTFDNGKCHWFADYGEGYTMNQDGTYEIDEEAGIVNITLELWDAPIEYNYVIDGNNLTLTATNGYSPSYNLSK